MTDGRKTALVSACRTNPNVCRVSYYSNFPAVDGTQGTMYVKCPCPRRCINRRKYHMYTIVDSDTVDVGGTFGRSSHCSVVGMGESVALVFEENEYRAKEIPYELNLSSGHIYKRRKKPYKVVQV